MALPQRRTKIVATIGPASSSPETIRELIAAGMNVARVTLAHGTVESQKALVSALRREADAVGSPLAILVDLPGPKVRTTAFAAPIDLATGDVVTLVAGTDEPSSASRFVVDYPTLVDDVGLGDDIAIGDGAVQCGWMGSEASLSATVTYGRHLSGRKGVNSNPPVSGERPTPNDLTLIAAMASPPIDIIAVSFVRSGAEMNAGRCRLVRIRRG